MTARTSERKPRKTSAKPAPAATLSCAISVMPMMLWNWRLGATGGWEEISLLSRAELEALFGPARPERAGPLVKSWVCVSPVGD